MTDQTLEKRTYTPAEICRLFGLNRTTLFRWEEDGVIPAAERDSKDQRIYRHEHLEKLTKIGLEKIRKEHVSIARSEPDEEAAYLNVDEKKSRLMAICSNEPLFGVLRLQVLVEHHRPLLEETVELLQEVVKLHPTGAPMREKIWLLLAKQNEAVRRQQNEAKAQAVAQI